MKKWKVILYITDGGQNETNVVDKTLSPLTEDEIRNIVLGYYFSPGWH